MNTLYQLTAIDAYRMDLFGPFETEEAANEEAGHLFDEGYESVTIEAA